MDHEQLLTIEDVAWLLQIAPKTLYNQRYPGEAPGALSTKIGSAVRFRSEDIDRWLADQDPTGAVMCDRDRGAEALAPASPV